MRAHRVLQKCLSTSLAALHKTRERALLRAVDALVAGRRLTLMDVARSWPDAVRIRAPLKAFDRLLSNRHLHGERESLYADMARWLSRHPQPVIVIDWSDLKADRSWGLLRAAVPVGGRTLPVLDMVFPGHEYGSPGAEKRFLQRLKQVIPDSVTPVLVTDAGFRSPWFREVDKLGWHWLGRLRHQTLLKPVDAKGEDDWWPSRGLYALLQGNGTLDMGLMDTVRRAPWVCRVVLHRKAIQGRKHRNLNGQPARSALSRKSARRQREPWLLVASPSLALSARQLVTLYGRRMQIQQSFRDLKSHRHGYGFEDSQTRLGKRLEVLLLVQALASFACWLAGLACKAEGKDTWLAPGGTQGDYYSCLRIGREALSRSWPMAPLSQWLERLRTLPPEVLEHMQVPA